MVCRCRPITAQLMCSEWVPANMREARIISPLVGSHTFGPAAGSRDGAPPLSIRTTVELPHTRIGGRPLGRAYSWVGRMTAPPTDPTGSLPAISERSILRCGAGYDRQRHASAAMKKFEKVMICLVCRNLPKYPRARRITAATAVPRPAIRDAKWIRFDFLHGFEVDEGTWDIRRMSKKYLPSKAVAAHLWIADFSVSLHTLPSYHTLPLVSKALG